MIKCVFFGAGACQVHFDASEACFCVLLTLLASDAGCCFRCVAHVNAYIDYGDNDGIEEEVRAGVDVLCGAARSVAMLARLSIRAGTTPYQSVECLCLYASEGAV